MTSARSLLWLLLLGLGACAANPAYDPDKPHHTPTGFRNIHDDDSKGFWDFLKWRWERTFKTIPGPDDYAFPVAASRHAQLQSNRERPTLTWIGHATFLLQFAGLNILTDPHFGERASPLSWAGPRRVVPPSPQLEQLPDIDVVLISHDHYDSLDLGTIRRLAEHNRSRTLTFLVPLGMKTWFEELDLDGNGIRVVELDWGEQHRVAPVSFSAEPSQHWGKRTLFDAYTRLWVSWVISAQGRKIYFAGDTGYSPQFAEIGRKHGGFDLALLPIGAYEPRWFMKPYHVNPEEAVRIHLDVGSRYSVAMHWGTFVLTDEPLDEPPARLAEVLAGFNVDPRTFEVFRHGETRFLDDRLGPSGSAAPNAERAAE